MEDIKVICCDIDGTLVRDDKTLSDGNIFWIHKAVVEKGVHFTLVSGRMAKGVRPFYDRIGITGPVSCFNGGTLVDEDGNIVDDHRMPREMALRLCDLRDDLGLDLVLFNGMKWYLETRDCYAYPGKVKAYECDCEVGNFRELLSSFDTNKVVFMSPDPGLLDKARDLLPQYLEEGTYTPYRNFDFLEVMAAGYDKGSAIDALSRHFNVPTSRIMALGDDYNDVAMLRKAGLGVAMANAVKEAKEASDYITDSNNNDGVAKAIRRFIFKEDV